MDCRNINRNELHERYLMGQLDSDEAAGYAAHVQQCPNCQKRQRHEKVLLAGVRSIGRTAMKAEIKHQAALLEQRSSTGWPWIYKLAAAALLCLLTPTLFYVYRSQVEPVLNTQQVPVSTSHSVVKPADLDSRSEEVQTAADESARETDPLTMAESEKTKKPATEGEASARRAAPPVQLSHVAKTKEQSVDAGSEPVEAAPASGEPLQHKKLTRDEDEQGQGAPVSRTDLDVNAMETLPFSLQQEVMSVSLPAEEEDDVLQKAPPEQAPYHPRMPPEGVPLQPGRSSAGSLSLQAGDRQKSLRRSTVAPEWQFRIGDNFITFSPIVERRDRTMAYPDSFTVFVTQTDETRWALACYVTGRIARLPVNEIAVTADGQLEALTLVFEDSAAVYSIELKEGETTARRVRER